MNEFASQMLDNADNVGTSILCFLIQSALRVEGEAVRNLEMEDLPVVCLKLSDQIRLILKIRP